MWVNSDFSELLSLSTAHKVRYLVIGGYALIRYTEPRYTKDLDLWIDPEAGNARAVYDGLREFGAPLTNLTAEDFSQEDCFYQMGVPPLRVDILMSIPGVPFGDAWERREEVQFGSLQVPFISREDLIQAKLASGHPRDLLDVDLLREAEDLD